MILLGKKIDLLHLKIGGLKTIQLFTTKQHAFFNHSPTFLISCFAMMQLHSRNQTKNSVDSYQDQICIVQTIGCIAIIRFRNQTAQLE